jgi:hypothetical protein
MRDQDEANPGCRFAHPGYACFLTAIDRDIEIVVRPRDKRARKAQRGQITFKPVAA